MNELFFYSAFVLDNNTVISCIDSLSEDRLYINDNINSNKFHDSSKFIVNEIKFLLNSNNISLQDRIIIISNYIAAILLNNFK